jgi:hypothetical protein
MIDSSNATGSLEFNISSRAGPSAFFPLQVSFGSSSTFCDVVVDRVLDMGAGGGAVVRYGETRSLQTEGFIVQ